MSAADDEPPVDERDTDELTHAGYAALRHERYDDALAIAAELRRRRFSASFEIEARARWAREEFEQAIAALEEGVTRAPQAAPLWHWLACFRSDAGNYAGALEAFEREAEFADVAAAATSYNVAVVYERMGRFADALEVLERVERPDDVAGPSPGEFAELRARLLLALDRADDAIAAATESIELIGVRLDDLDDLGDVDEVYAVNETDETDETDEVGATDDSDQHVSDTRRRLATLGRAYATRAAARLRCDDRDGAEADAQDAILYGSASDEPLPAGVYDVLRQLDAARSPTAKVFRVLLRGEMPAGDFDDLEPADPEGMRGFFLPMEIVADGAADALGYARRFVPEPARETVTFEEMEAIEPAPNELKGVVHCGAFHTWAAEAGSDDDDDEGGGGGGGGDRAA